MPKADKKAKKQQGSKSKEGRGSVLINFVLDKSGSMDSKLADTIGGFNTYLKSLREDTKTDYKFSLTLFDTRFEERHVLIPLEDVPELSNANYIPGGGTALYDAIGRSVTSIESKGDKVGKVVCVILTDGEENSSREYSLAAVRGLITRKEQQGNWTFIFLGADLGAFAVGDQMGVKTANSVVYDANNVRAVYSNLAHATMHFSASASAHAPDFMKSVEHTRAYKMSGMRRRA